MVRNYKRKTERGSATPQLMQEAADFVRNKNKSVRESAQLFGVHYSTLQRFIHKTSGNTAKNNTHVGYAKPRQVFTCEQEEELVSYLKTAAAIYFGLSPREVKELAFKCANEAKIEMPDNWRNDKYAGKDWFSGFMKRHGQELSIRQPEATSLSRATSFNKHNVELFFSKLSSLMDKYKFEPQDIWNADESGVTTVQKPRAVVAVKGTKQVSSLTSAERGQLVTFCVAVSAIGGSVPPMLIFPRKNYHDHFIRDGPEGSIGACHPSGWMTQDNFLLFMKHFIKHTKATVEKPILLLLDNHQSHVNYDVITLCKENGVVLLSFPPHCSHKLQPLDRSVYGPFKRYPSSAQNDWLRSNPGKRMTIYDIPSQVKKAFLRASTPINITSGFKVSGISPLNTNIFDDWEFAPSSVTDRPVRQQCEQDAAKAMQDVLEISKSVDEHWFSSTSASMEPHPSSSTASEPLPSTSTAVGPQPAVASFITDQVETANVGESSLCPEKIMPHPKATPRKKKCNTGRKARKKAILTDTPERNALFAEAIKKKNKKNDVKEKKATKKRKQEFLHKVRSKKPVEKYDISSSDDEDWARRERWVVEMCGNKNGAPSLR
ncbi:uncharacterized protein LOC135098820 [Scylla paramamosain]|uniref:uncharacterized protein LOC135098820 n=1 Tax=Scylla paramamosain TaxID=85552 RepID=UPI0030835942